MNKLRLTFAIGSIGPSSDGDVGGYYLASIVREDPSEALTNQTLRDWAEGQMLDELEAQGDYLGEAIAFVAYMGSEEEYEEGLTSA